MVFADVGCDGTQSVVDVLLTIQWALGVPISQALDANGNNCPDACDDPPAGDCCSDNGTAFCDNDACTLAVCALDEFCCESMWDGYCAACASGQPGYGGQDCSGTWHDCAPCWDCPPDWQLGCDGEACVPNEWLGDGNLPEDLPLPRLIDLELRPGHGLDAHALEIRLQASLSNVTVDDTKLWIDRLADLGRSLELLALTVFALILCAVIVTVIFTTRMGISIHRNVIELLHLIGAQDGFIAAQFQRQAMMMGLRGGVIGIVFAVATVYGLLHVFKRLETPLVPDIPAEHWTWVLLTAVPIAMAGIAMLTARLTALRELAKLP